MGAWMYVQPRINTALRDMCAAEGAVAREVQYIGRAASAATATASPDIHSAELKDLLEAALLVENFQQQ